MTTRRTTEQTIVAGEIWGWYDGLLEGWFQNSLGEFWYFMIQEDSPFGTEDEFRTYDAWRCPVQPKLPKKVKKGFTFKPKSTPDAVFNEHDLGRMWRSDLTDKAMNV